MRLIIKFITKFKLLLLVLLLNITIFGKVPQRAVSVSQFTTEVLLAIGAEEQIIGTAFLDNEILPELEQKFNKIPVLSNKYPTKELFYSLNPDFVTGWRSLANFNNLGTEEELKNHGIEVFFMKSLEDGNIEEVFDDILGLGKIFDKDENAKILVEKMANNLKKIKENTPKNTVSIFVYDSGEGVPFTVGGKGVPNNIIELAGGANIFKDINKSFGNGSWEKVLAEDPERIVVIDYGDNKVQQKIDYLKEKSSIKDLNAIKNNRISVIKLIDISAGIRNIDAIKKLMKDFHNIDIK